MSDKPNIEAAREFYSQCHANCNIVPSCPELMEAFAAEQNKELAEKCATLATQLERAEKALRRDQGLCNYCGQTERYHKMYETVRTCGDFRNAAYDYFKDGR